MSIEKATELAKFLRDVFHKDSLVAYIGFDLTSFYACLAEDFEGKSTILLTFLAKEVVYK